MILRIISPILILFLLFFSLENAIAFEDEEAGIFAGFIKNVAQTSQGGSKGSLCVFGGDEISKIISKDELVINLNDNLEKYSLCKAIYIANDKKKVIKLDITKFNAKKILTIATFAGFIENGGVLQVEMGRRNFELTLNEKVAKESSIKLNSLVMELIIN